MIPPGERTSPLIGSIGAVSTFVSTRALLRRSRARPWSRRCRRRCQFADRLAPSIDNRAVHRRCGCTVGPCARCNCLPGKCDLPFSLLATEKQRRWSGSGAARFPFHCNRKRRRRLADFHALRLQRAQQFGLIAWPHFVAWKDVSRGTFVLRFIDRALALDVKVFEKELAVVAEMVERRQQRRLLVVVVVSLRPLRFWQWRILTEPRALILIRRECSIECVGAAVAESLIQVD